MQKSNQLNLNLNFTMNRVDFNIKRVAGSLVSTALFFKDLVFKNQISKVQAKNAFMGLVAVLSTLAMLLAPGAYANELDVSVSDESFRVNYNMGFRGNDVNSDLDYFYNDEDEVGLIGLGLFVSGRSNASTGRQTAGIGVRLVHADLDGDNGSALTFGGFIKHRLSQANLLSVKAGLFVAPSVTSFDRVEDYLEFSFGIEYELLDAADVYLAYRDIEIDLGDGDFELDDTLVLGLIMKF